MAKKILTPSDVQIKKEKKSAYQRRYRSTDAYRAAHNIYQRQYRADKDNPHTGICWTLDPHNITSKCYTFCMTKYGRKNGSRFSLEEAVIPQSCGRCLGFHLLYIVIKGEAVRSCPTYCGDPSLHHKAFENLPYSYAISDSKRVFPYGEKNVR